jgi:hypothetical protein
MRDTSRAILARIGAGVPAGANRPNQVCAKSSPYASAKVGMSGTSGERVLALTASATMRPLCRCGTMLESASSATGVEPDRTAVTTSLPPRNGTSTRSTPDSRLSFSMKYTSGNEKVA